MFSTSVLEVPLVSGSSSRNSIWRQPGSEESDRRWSLLESRNPTFTKHWVAWALHTGFVCDWSPGMLSVCTPPSTLHFEVLENLWVEKPTQCYFLAFLGYVADHC